MRRCVAEANTFTRGTSDRVSRLETSPEIEPPERAALYFMNFHLKCSRNAFSMHTPNSNAS